MHPWPTVTPTLPDDALHHVTQVRDSGSRRVARTAPRISEKADPIGVHHGLHIRFGIGPLAEEVCDFLKIGDGLEVGRRLFFAESAVEVATDGGVAGVACELSDMVDVVGDSFERNLRIGSLPGDVAGKEHPAI